MADQVFLGAVFTNTDVVPLLPGDVLIRDLTLDNGAKRTTTVASNLVLGVALGGADPGHQVSVATVMGQRVTMRILNGAVVVRGDRLVTDSTSGLVRVDNAVGLGQIIAVATRSKTAGGGTTIEGILVAGGAGLLAGSTTLQLAYTAGTLAADQTLTLLDSKGGGLVLDATNGGFTGTTALKIQTAAGDLSVARATGFLGVNVSTPLKELHLKGTLPTIRFHYSNGSTTHLTDVDASNSYLSFRNATAAILMGYFHLSNHGFYARGGLVTGDAAVASAVGALTMPANQYAALAPAGTARLRYNDNLNRLEVSFNGGAYVGVDTSP